MNAYVKIKEEKEFIIRIRPILVFFNITDRTGEKQSEV